MKHLVTLIFAATMAISTAATTWTGSLTSDNGIFGTEQWNQGVTLQWTVTEIDPTNWEYSYTLTVPAKDISHGIVEACGGTVYSSTSNGKSNPLMPNPIEGVKYESVGLSDTWSYTSANAPSWGSVYAKSGKNNGNDVVLWTTGLNGGTGYVPVAGCDGSVNSIPEPSKTTLIGLGGLALILRRRRYIRTYSK